MQKNTFFYYCGIHKKYGSEFSELKLQGGKVFVRFSFLDFYCNSNIHKFVACRNLTFYDMFELNMEKILELKLRI